MSRYGGNWRRPEPAWGRPHRTKHHLAPPGLRGKALGLYFRDLRRKNGGKKEMKELLINLKIPRAIEAKSQVNLDTITKIAEKLNIPISWPKLPKFKKARDVNMENEVKWFSNKWSDDEDVEFDPIPTVDLTKEPEPNEEIFKKPKTPEPVKSAEPCSSSAPDFIPIGSDVPEYGSGDRILSLRGQSEYKYSYEDIITGTFDEKLDECLSKGVDINCNNCDINEINQSLYEEYHDMMNRQGYKKMLKFRETLPTYKKGDQLLDIIYKNQVIVISGETGCGKSTQVPQLILDSYLRTKKGGNVKILVTQPRRIAASSLAARVAAERGEKMGNSVGYAVRLEKVDARPRGSITFCTTGILLADLEVNQGLTNYSHVILDEVHERDCHIDLSMCMLKKVLKKRADLKLILMSATIDADKLSQYFNNSPMMHIEGLAYPVQDIYLEDILHVTKYELPEEKKKGNNQRWMQHRKKISKREAKDKDAEYKAEIAPWIKSISHNYDSGVIKTLSDFRIEELNIDLICELLIHICRGGPGAILVFLPGIGEITKLINFMERSSQFPIQNYEIYPLHSKLPSLEQHKIFERPPVGVRKIIIATNIAETSITIDDIVYVIDCGKIKMSGLNIEENVSTLKIEWISQANMRQRRGRAGRCQPGICYHLVTSFRALRLPERLLPELQRSNLLEPVLTLKRLRLGIAVEAFKNAPSPPDESTVKWAVNHLQRCGALDPKETLTPLGWHMARLPLHPSAGKLVLLGALFGCLDRAASVAAVWGFKDPFQLVIGKEDEVDKVKRNFALGEPSDHVAISEAIIRWEQCSNNNKREFAYKHFLSFSTLELLSDMKNQLADNLKNMGFLSSGDVRSAWENRNANNLSLFKALVAAALYPNIGTVRWVNLNQSKRPKQIRIKVRTPEDARPVRVHPSSVMSAPQKMHGPITQLCNSPGANWLVYWLKQMSSDLFLIEVTLVYTLPLLFFGELNVSVNEVEVENECFMSISTVKVKCNRETTHLLFKLRSLLDQVLASKVMVSSDHGTRHSSFEESVLNAVIQIITAEDEQVEYPSDDDQSESDHSESEFNRGPNRPYHY